MAQLYNYTKTNVTVSILEEEILDSAISTGVLQLIEWDAPNSLQITFDVALSAGDVTILDGIVAAHPSGTSQEILGEQDEDSIVKNASGSTLTRGTPVYFSGTDNGVPEVSPADATDVGKMPAIGLVTTDILNGKYGAIQTMGYFNDFNTGTFGIGDVVYVADGGGLTATKPEGASKIQAIGSCIFSDASNGRLLLDFAATTEELPNLSMGKTWIGNASGVPVEATVQSEVNLQDEDTPVPGTPHDTINFEGAGVVVTNDGGGKATVTITGTGGGGSGGDLAVVQARRSTNYNDIPTTWTDLTFDVTDVENTTTTVEHDDTNRDRITIKADGWYALHYILNCDDEIQGRIRVNDTTVIPGSTQTSGDPGDVNDVVTPNNVTVFYELSAGDFVTVQIQAATTAEILNPDALFLVQKLDGVLGPTGPAGSDGVPGSGSTLIVKDEGVNLPNTPHSALNFKGARITATDTGSGVVDIDVAGGLIAPLPTVQARRTNAYTTQTSWADVDFDTTDVQVDIAKLEHSVSNPDRIVIHEDGTYYVAYQFSLEKPSGSDENALISGRVRANDSTVVLGSTGETNALVDGSLVGSDGNDPQLQQACICQCSDGDFLTVQLLKTQETGTTTVNTKVNGTFIVYKLEASHGQDGVDGTDEISVQSNGTPLVNTPHETLNFTGTKLTVTNAGGGVAQIDSTHDHDERYYTESEIDNLDINAGNF